jgi:hypothetical protein
LSHLAHKQADRTRDHFLRGVGGGGKDREDKEGKGRVRKGEAGSGRESRNEGGGRWEDGRGNVACMSVGDRRRCFEHSEIANAAFRLVRMLL